jgi:hypothetical protein
MDPTASIADEYKKYLSRVAETPLYGLSARQSTLTELLIRREMISQLVLRVPEDGLHELNAEREIIEGELRLRFAGASL